ncbi:MAG: hypothetical protein H6706_02180 [Myxococcales bacterium]|nr:hypothetical protein [Myxococcales bacterium]
MHTLAYSTPLDHLADEIRWVKARCRHLGARIEADKEADEAVGLIDAAAESDGVCCRTKQKVARLATAEGNLRTMIDRRIAASAAAGVALPLVNLREEHGLDPVEADLLVLAAVPAMGLDLYTVMGEIGQFSFGLMSVSPEMSATFSELDLAGRVALRDRLAEDGTLVKARLVESDWDGDKLADFWISGVYLQGAAFDAITGRAARPH